MWARAMDAALVDAAQPPQPGADPLSLVDPEAPASILEDAGFDRMRFGVDEWHGTNAFFRDGDRILRTSFVNNRGNEAMGSTWSYLDITALGRQEEWEGSPKGYPQTPPYQWWNLHDEYERGD
jgi:predicted dithiol-disulfide oxidoreductase (DUF899 family)